MPLPRRPSREDPPAPRESLLSVIPGTREWDELIAEKRAEEIVAGWQRKDPDPQDTAEYRDLEFNL